MGRRPDGALERDIMQVLWRAHARDFDTPDYAEDDIEPEHSAVDSFPLLSSRGIP